VAFDFAAAVEADFENFMLTDLGESVTYYAYNSSITYSTASATEVDGYLLSTGSPTGSTVSVIIATFTEKDINLYDVGNLGVDDHKAYIPNSITPVEKDRILRADGQLYEVVSILHQHAVAGTVNFYTVHIRRRRT